MYQISRSIYREIEARSSRTGSGATARRTTSASCARVRPRSSGSRRTGTTSPGRRKTLFNDIRAFFPMSAQLHVYRVVDRYMRFARRLARRPARRRCWS